MRRTGFFEMVPEAVIYAGEGERTVEEMGVARRSGDDGEDLGHCSMDKCSAPDPNRHPGGPAVAVQISQLAAAQDNSGSAQILEAD